MKLVLAFFRPESFEPIREELLGKGIPSLSISQAQGSGRQEGITETYRGSTVEVNLRPKVRFECVVHDEDVKTVTDAILAHAQSGSIGDGKIFVLPVEDAIRVRTGEMGEEVLQLHSPDDIVVS